MRALIALGVFALLCAPASGDEPAKAAAAGAPEKGLSLVVMDPLAAPLSCPCVAGYAQRKYEKLGEYLSEVLGQPVQVTFAESFEKALEQKQCTVIDIAIGKDSVVRHDAAVKKLKVTPLARLTGKDGKTTQKGLIVVRAEDPARKLEDLKGYRVLFGTAACQEKFAAPWKLLTSAGVELPAVEKCETTESCSDGATKIIEWGDSQRAAAVISSYAAPLLEGCGTIKKGDLRVVAETEAVPFVTAFTTDRVNDELREEVRLALLTIASRGELLAALETLIGFVPLGDDYRPLESTPAEKAKPQRVDAAAPGAGATSAWPGWRGPQRDGRAALPTSLPTKPHIVWRQPLRRPGLGGVAATSEFVILGDRDISNMWDEFRCYSAADGQPRWILRYPAMGKLDYDNLPRATPLVHQGNVYLLGAFGNLTCVEMDTGTLLWQRNLILEFEGERELVWGFSSSPLVVDDKLIVNPGGAEASLVALDPATGETLWQSPGDRHAYASFIVATLGGVRQIVGYDRTTLGGWDAATGRRLWTLKPQHAGDFNVPTPVAIDGKLLVVSENNGARLYGFAAGGQINPGPIATNSRLAPNISSPVVVGQRAFCVSQQMHCLDLANGLRPVWIGDDNAFCNYSPLVASDERVLALGRGGELLLVDATSDKFRIVSRLQLFDDPAVREAELLTYPAIVGTRMFLRGEKELVCVELAPPAG